MTFVFGTKAETLARLRTALGPDLVCDLLYFSARDWQEDRAGLTTKALERFNPRELVVRSSNKAEDGAEESHAGAFLSLIGVAPEPEAFMTAVDRVLTSYGRVFEGDQVLIQPRVLDVVLAGVVTTRNLDTGAPYYVVNYDDHTGRTDSVTSGAESKTIFVHRERVEALQSPRIAALIMVVKEIESLARTSELDIEFCVTRSGQVYILQVRPLAASRAWVRLPDALVDEQIDGARRKFAGFIAPPDNVLGERTLFGQMPDWNPAEMIGSLPRPLAYSLYRHLITDHAWAEARAHMGYRDMRGQPLMQSFAGRPYIDVRNSFNSFLPAKLNEGIADRLINHQLAVLADRRELHDRIEFEVAMPSLDFAFEPRRSQLADAGLSESEIEEFRAALGSLTVSLVEGGAAGMRALELQTDTLQSVREPDLQAAAAACRRDGTVPFAMLARHAFISVTFLKSLVRRGIIDLAAVDSFIGTIRTVTAEFVSDLFDMHEGRLATAAFLERYGHLRPGTYDITSPRYDREPSLYLGGHGVRPNEHTDFSFGDEARRGIAACLAEVGIRLSVDDFLYYTGEAIRLRELAKFRFTRAISNMIEVIADWGERYDFSRDDLSYATLDDLAGGDAGLVRERIESARERFVAERLVSLPHLITRAEDFDVIRMPLNVPTYITQSTVTSHAIQLVGQKGENIDGKIVLIESADPGFDWIFSHPIAGLITQFGGANSHMAIRCAEFRLPAAIGCGERLFTDLVRARMIELNCAAHSVRRVS
jgi:hypothetical protein